MRTTHRLALLTLLLTIAGATASQAAVINVAEFRWDAILNPGVACPDPSTDPDCAPIDPFTSALFTLTNVWDGPTPGPTLFNNRLSLPSGDRFFFDLDTPFPFQFEQLEEGVPPSSAMIDISFLFGGDTLSLGATLTQPDTFAVLRFDPADATTPVPEPGTFGLLAIGATLLARRARLRRGRARS